MEEIKYPILKFIWKYKKANIIFVVIFFLLSIWIAFFAFPKEFTSLTTILPPASNLTSSFGGNLGALSKLAGIDISGSKGLKPEMLEGILKSRLLQEQIFKTYFEFEDKGKPKKENLYTFFEIQSDSELEINEKALKKMADEVVGINIDNDNDILSLSVTTENPVLSSLVANKMIEILNEIVRNDVQKEYRQKLAYLKERLIEIQDSLRIAENDYKKFLEINLDPTVPVFQIKQIQLKRQIELQNGLYIEFRKQLEIFILDNMINLADIKVLDHAQPPFRKSRPKRAMLLVTFFSLFLIAQLGVNTGTLIWNNLHAELNKQ